MDRDRKEDREILRKGGFAESEVTQLTKLRASYKEVEHSQTLEDHRRFEFVRWLISKGKLSDQLA